VLWLSSLCWTCWRLVIPLTIQRSCVVYTDIVRFRGFSLRLHGSLHTSMAARSASAAEARTRILHAVVKFRVPLGSVLCPILFLLYTVDLLRLIELHNLFPHSYADDTQIYGFCRPGATAQLQDRMTACNDDVALWMQ